jgi:hypothetical protein
MKEDYTMTAMTRIVLAMWARHRIAASVALLIAGLLCLAPERASIVKHAHAQVTLTGAGRGAPTAPAGFTGPGDIVSGAYAWYSCARAYNTADTSAACNVCLPSDTTCADLTISGGFAVVPAGLSTCNITTVICTVKTLYDKSGNSQTLTQSTIANRATFRPAMASNGCPTTALPCFKLVQANSQAYIGPATTISQPITISLVYIRGGVTGEPAGNGVTLIANSGNIQLFAGTGGATATAADGSWHAVQSVFNAASSSAYVDGTNTALNPGTGGASSNFIQIGLPNVNAYFDGVIGEVGFWAADFTNVGGIDKRSAMNSNQHGSSGFNF